MIVSRMRLFAAITTLLVATGLSSNLVGQERQTIDQLMTPEEQARTCVESLTPVQQAEFETWITAWTRYVAKYTQQKAGVKTDVA